MSKPKRVIAEKIDPRDVLVDEDILISIAECPTGGSGNGEYIRGRIQSMAREILKYRTKEGEKND